MIEDRTSCPVIPATSVTVSWDYDAVRVSFGSQQEMFSAFNGNPQGLQPNWLITANLSPQTALQLHAILGESLRQYEESIGPLPRLDVMFEKRGSGVPISAGGGQVVALKLVPKAEPEEAKLPEAPADYLAREWGDKIVITDVAEKTLEAGVPLSSLPDPAVINGELQYCPHCQVPKGQHHAIWCGTFGKV